MNRPAHLGARITALAVLGVLSSVLPHSLAAPPPTSASSGPADLTFFETKIRPVLAERCYKCHQEKQKGGLRLDNRQALLTGGDSGPALESGNPDASLIIQAVRYTGDGVEKMPPDKKLPDHQVADLVRWVKTGAPWTESTAPTTTAARHDFKITDADRDYWAFRPLTRPQTPRVEGTAWALTPVDRFILAPLESKKLRPAAPATQRDLLRRASFDLIGLPPTPEQLDAFERDKTPDAYERQLDRLLATPQYGERWARHWLDVVRYAQTNGYERDDEKPFAWRYRDYVIHALNQDKPYDQFVREQLAGDRIAAVTTESLIATGFYRLGIWDDEPDDKRQAAFDEFDDIVGTTSQAFLGLTIQCARCHDHKFDPIAQKDYYRLVAFFRNIKGYELPSYERDPKTLAPLAPHDEVHRWYSQTQAKLTELESKRKATSDSDVRKSLDAQIDQIQKTPPPFPPGLIISEHAGPAPKTHVLFRGNPGTPGEAVKAGFPAVLEPPASSGTPEPNAKTSRLDLADWIASPSNPLTARVIVNRVWQHHFGRALVPTPNDFGKAGIAPTHPQLLDWLAADFIASGWSLKALHKQIMLSQTYRMSSPTDNPAALAIDEGNTLYWRQNLRRLEAESIRDSVLAISGTLNPAMGGRGEFPRLSKEVLVGGSRPGRGWEVSPRSPYGRRGVYLFIKRTMLLPDLETFDYNNTASPQGERPITTVAPQALLMLNSEFFRDQANAFAANLRAAAPGDTPRQTQLAFSRALGRLPSDSEVNIALDYLRRRTQEIEAARPPLTFQFDVPTALFNGYLNQLEPTDIVRGPADNWRYGKGRWGNGYEQIDALNPLQSPFALWSGATFTDGSIETQLRLDPASESAALMFRATPAGDGFHGYDITLDAKNSLVTLRAHTAGKPRELAEARYNVTPAHWHKIKVATTGPRIRVWLDAAKNPLIDAHDPAPIASPGHLGFRIWGSSIDVKELWVETDKGRTRIDTPKPLTPEAVAQQALASLCLVILNLNEVIYVK